MPEPPDPFDFEDCDDDVPEDEVEVELELDGAGAQDSDTLTIGPRTGSDSADTGVPGGTFTVKVSFCPPATVTVTTHVSADAVGSAASPVTPRMAPALATAINSLRLLNALACLLLPTVCARLCRNRPAAWTGSY